MTISAGWVILDKHLSSTLVVLRGLMALFAAGLIAAWNATAAIILLLGFGGLLATPAPVGWWGCLTRTLPHDEETGGGLTAAVIQVSITVGATSGGLLVYWNRYQPPFALSALLLLASAAMSVASARLMRC